MADTQALQYRMYFFVPYNLSPIQQAIQAGHAALEYARLHGDTEIFKEFVTNHKTWIILNGGTTNGKLREGLISSRTEPDPYRGSLDNLYIKLIDWNLQNKDKQILEAIFMEPDLNDALTAICFIADERVWNYEKYPDFEDIEVSIDADYYAARMQRQENIGEQNLFLRELIRDKRLA